MLSLRHYLRPYKTIRMLRQLVEAQEKNNALLRQLVESQNGLMKSQSRCIDTQDARLKMADADLALAKASTVVNKRDLCDGIVDPPEGKGYIN